MVKKLKELGYNVYLYDYLNTKVDYNVDYDLFIGHNKTFDKIAAKLRPNCKKVLLTTGSSPYHDNQILSERETEVQLLKNTKDSFFSPMANIDWVNANFRTADYILMLGNDTIRKTWPIFDNNKIFYYIDYQNRFSSHSSIHIVFFSSHYRTRSPA